MIEFILNPLKDNAYKKVEEAIHDYVFGSRHTDVTNFDYF